MSKDDIELLGIKETLSSHARPGVVAFALWELLNCARYSPDEIREISAEMLGFVDFVSSKTSLSK